MIWRVTCKASRKLWVVDANPTVGLVHKPRHHTCPLQQAALAPHSAMPRGVPRAQLSNQEEQQEQQQQQQQQQQQEAQASLPLLDLPAACLRSVLFALWQEPADVAAFACCSSATKELCDDPLLWRHLLTQRYGPDVLPGVPGAWLDVHSTPLGTTMRGLEFNHGYEACTRTHVVQLSTTNNQPHPQRNTP
jgi:hypothetical protein